MLVWCLNASKVCARWASKGGHLAGKIPPFFQLLLTSAVKGGRKQGLRRWFWPAWRRVQGEVVLQKSQSQAVYGLKGRNQHFELWHHEIAETFNIPQDWRTSETLVKWPALSNYVANQYWNEPFEKIKIKSELPLGPLDKGQHWWLN